jgi:hypothetical protein
MHRGIVTERYSVWHAGRAKAFVAIRGEEGRTGRGTHSTADNQGAFACALADASSATLEAA